MKESETLKKEFTVRGKVQGVFFRKFTKAEADKLGIHGYVRNQEDGSVYCVAQGTREEMLQFEAFLHKGSPKAKVLSVTSRPWEGDVGPGFEIRRV